MVFAEEKAAAIKKKQKEERRLQEKLNKGGLKQKTAKKKGIRIRKGVQIRGIKVVDSETKQAVKRKLQEEAETKMDQD